MNTAILSRFRTRLGLHELDRQVLALTAALWLLQFAFMVSRNLSSGTHPDGGAIFARFITALTALLLSLGLYWVLKRGPGLPPLTRFFETATLGVPACALLALVDQFALARLSAEYPASPGVFVNPGEYVFTFGFFFWIFVAWSALVATLSNAEQLREHERHLSAVKSAAAAAQLRALQLQFHPHFLFNTLNVLSGLIGIGRSIDAERVIQNLSAFLRHTLAASPDKLVPLAEELEFQRSYVNIQSIRFGNRLRVRYAVEDACSGALTPSLLLLPLIENALKHAMARTEGAVTVTIGAQRQGDALELWVADERDGKESGASATGFGIGLVNVRERLQALYGERAAFVAGPTKLGWLSRLSIPWTVVQ
jgi:two-component system LytT family sensor kinase